MPAANTSSRLDAADIDRAHAISIADVASELGFAFDRAGNHAGPCSRCGGKDRFSISMRKGAFLCRQCHPKGGGGAIALVMFLDACGFRDAVETLIGERDTLGKSVNFSDLPAKGSSAYEDRQHSKAAWLWSQRKPISRTLAEVYLREARQITCPLPPTLGFLAPRKPDQYPAMIAAFGLCDEVEPGLLAAPRDVQAVHLTLLKPDGSGKAEVKPNKLMIGSPGGKPIVMAPPNDLFGLAIIEGIEDALSIHQSTGLGAWPPVARLTCRFADSIPDYVECVSICVDDNEGGRTNSAKLGYRLQARGIEVWLIPPFPIEGRDD